MGFEIMGLVPESENGAGVRYGVTGPLAVGWSILVVGMLGQVWARLWLKRPRDGEGFYS